MKLGPFSSLPVPVPASPAVLCLSPIKRPPLPRCQTLQAVHPVALFPVALCPAAISPQNAFPVTAHRPYIRLLHAPPPPSHKAPGGIAGG